MLFLLITTSLLQAQNQDKKPITRKGFVFGTAAGVSSLRLSGRNIGNETQAGLSFPNFKIGTMVGDRTALLMYLPGSIYAHKREGRQRDRGFEGILPSVQYWVKNRWWLLGGAGLAMDAPAFYDIQEDSERKFYFGAGMIAGAGYEIWQGRRSALDVQLRAHYGSVKRPEDRLNGYAFSLLLGFNWY